MAKLQRIRDYRMISLKGDIQTAPILPRIRVQKRAKCR